MNSEYLLENDTQTVDCEQQCVVSTEYDHKQNIAELINFFLSVSGEPDLQTRDETADSIFLPASSPFLLGSL